MTEPMMGYLLTGAAAAAVVKLLDNLLIWLLNHSSGRKTSLDAKIDGLVRANRLLLFDRIQHLGQAHIADGQISFDDRRRLNEMHHVYHEGLGGNGDLDVLMQQVNKLPLE